jgi:hypothetical protein
MALNSTNNVYLTPIDLRQKIAGRGVGNVISDNIEQVKYHIIDVITYDEIKIGDVVGILDNIQRNKDYILTNPLYSDTLPNQVIGFKQCPILYPFYDISDNFY